MGFTTSFAPGKLILSGEHSVVHGWTAIALAVQRGCQIRLHPRSGPSGVDHAPIHDERLEKAIHQVLPSEGVGVHIESEIPIGRGMGSSAAMTVALIRAMAELNGDTLGFSEIHKRGFELERIFHGNPSGIDHAVSALGGILVYRKGRDGPEMQQVEASLPPIIVIDSGSAGNTATQVQKVQERGHEGRSICRDIHQITQAILELFHFTTKIPLHFTSSPWASRRARAW